MGRKPSTSDDGKRVLAKIRKIKPFVEGSITTTKKRCGNPRCRCAQEGPIHETTLLTWKEGQKTHTLYVPRDLRKEVAQWISQRRQLRKLIREMSQAQRAFLISKKKSKKS